MNTFWTQIDVSLGNKNFRFYMDDCNGKDQVALAVNQHGWMSYESPLPFLIAKLCCGCNGLFIDVGANTGYYSLLAASTGASYVYAFEPVPHIRHILEKNMNESALGKIINVSDFAVGEVVCKSEIYLPDDSHGLVETSASLNKDFRKDHSEILCCNVTTLDSYFNEKKYLDSTHEILVKIDVESLEKQVLLGANHFIKRYRPIIFLELLPDCDHIFFLDFIQQNDYHHIWLNSSNTLKVSDDSIELSMNHRDHMFLPKEKHSLLNKCLASS